MIQGLLNPQIQHCRYRGLTMRLEHLWILVSMGAPGTNPLCIPRDDSIVFHFLFFRVFSFSVLALGKWWFHKMLLWFLKEFVQDWYCVFLKYLMEFNSEAILAWNFLCGKVLSTNSISALGRAPDFLFLFLSVLIICIF